MDHSIIYTKLKKSKFIAGLAADGSLGQMIRYVITGLSSAAVEFTLLFVLKDIAGLSLIASNTAALSAVFWINFLMNRLWAFRSTMKLCRQLPMYLLLFTINMGASDLLMHVLAGKMQIQYLLAKVLSLGIMSCWNFVLYQKVIYK